MRPFSSDGTTASDDFADLTSKLLTATLALTVRRMLVGMRLWRGRWLRLRRGKGNRLERQQFPRDPLRFSLAPVTFRQSLRSPTSNKPSEAWSVSLRRLSHPMYYCDGCKAQRGNEQEQEDARDEQKRQHRTWPAAA